MTQELKPCPFCGAPGKLDSGEMECWMAYCGQGEDNIVGCPTLPETGFFDSRDEAVAAWNRRAAQPEEGSSHGSE